MATRSIVPKWSLIYHEGSKEHGFYANPFSFWIFEYENGFCDVVVHFGSKTKTGTCSNIEKAKNYCRAFALHEMNKAVQKVQAI